MSKFLLFLILLIFPFFVWADNSGNSTGYAWFEKIGWVHFSGEDAGVDYGIKISSDQITGYAWSEKTGWISLSCLNSLSCNGQPYGVVSDGEGNLSGYAWSEKGGWINFNGVGTVEYQVQIDSNGNLSGYAWSEKVGWINTDDIGENYGVTTVAGEGYCEDCVPCNPPVLAWNLDEGFGMTAYDSSFRGNNIYNNGTVAGGAVWQSQSECVSGKCLYFDGSNDNINRAYDSDLSFKSNSFSIGGWFKTSTVANPAYLFSRYDTAGWKVWLDADGDACFGIDDDNVWSGETPDDFVCTVGKNYDDNTWHYILAERDVAGGIYLYLDGQEEVSDLTLTATGPLSGTSPIFYAGVNSDGTTSLFGGFLDSIKIYDYARSADQIKQDYNEGLSGISSNRGVSVSIGETGNSLSDGLVGYWKMDETSWNGTTNEVIDHSGNNNHGKAMGGAIPGAGKFGNGGGFDGTDDYVSVADSDSISVTNAYTYAAWVRYNSNSTDLDSLISKQGSDDIWSINRTNAGGSGNGGDVRMEITHNGTSYHTGWNYPYQQWFHLTVSWDGSTARIYSNGQLIDEFAISGDLDTGDFPLILGDGSNNFGWDGIFSGAQDEVRFYNRALSADEIKQLYNYAPGPVLHLKMDEKSGTTAYDSSGYNNHGTLTNGPIWENGKIGGATGFDGVDDYIGVAQSDILKPVSAVTFSAWIKHSGVSQEADCVVWDGGTADAYRINIDNYNTEGFFIGTSGLTGAVNWISTVDTNWHYVTGVFDGSIQTLSLYVDGIFRGNDTSAGSSIAYSSFGNQQLLFGKDSGELACDAQIDDVKIYNYARTQEQILEDMGASAEASASQGAGALGHPILDLNFDEGQGPIAYDASGNNNHGTLVSGATGTNTTSTMMWDKNGKKNGAMEFDGTNDYVEILNPGNILDGQVISMGAWVYPNSHPTMYSRIADRVFNGQFSFYIYGSNPYPLGVALNTTGTDVDANIVGCNVSLNQWVYVMVTYDGEDVNGYIDGKKCGTLATPSGNLANSTSDIRIGERVDIANGSRRFSGLIDEFKLYNYALSDDEIKTLYNGGSSLSMGGASATADNNGTTVSGDATEYCVPGDTAKCDKPVLELKLDEKTGTTAYDTSGNGNNGTLYNSPNWINGKNSGAVEFNGSNSGITRLGFYAPTEGTFSAWVKSDFNEATESSDHYIVSDGLGGVPNFRIRYQTGTYRYILYSGGLGLTLPAETSDIEGWWHVTAIWDSTGMSIYKDGKLWGSYVGNSQNSSGEGIIIGAASSNYATLTNLVNSWDGQIDEVRIYDYARTPAQIAWDYNRGKPIGHWKMDETSGTQVDDWSGNANHGTMTNMDPIGDRVAGKNNKALDFDGVDDYVNIDSIVNSFNNKKGSFSAWVKRDFLDTVSTDKYLFHAFYNNGNFHTIRYLEGTDQWEFAVDRAYTHNTVKLDASTVPQNVWTHVLMTWDEDGDDVKVYINGENKGSNSAGGSYVAVPTIGRIGTDRTNLFMFDGLIDDVKIFNYELTGEQVKLDYNNGAVNFR